MSAVEKVVKGFVVGALISMLALMIVSMYKGTWPIRVYQCSGTSV